MEEFTPELSPRGEAGEKKQRWVFQTKGASRGGLREARWQHVGVTGLWMEGQ